MSILHFPGWKSGSLDNVDLKDMSKSLQFFGHKRTKGDLFQANLPNDQVEYLKKKGLGHLEIEKFSDNLKNQIYWEKSFDTIQKNANELRQLLSHLSKENSPQ